MISLNINEQLFEAMRTKQPVIYRGIQYERILDYIIFWYDSSGVLRQSVVLLENRSSVRALVDEVKLVEKTEK